MFFIDRLQRFIDAYLQGDSLFRFVYKPATDELFLEDELEDSDNGQFLYVPFKNAQLLFMEMSYFADTQLPDVREALYDALSSPSPIGKFEKAVEHVGVEAAWHERKITFVKQQLYHWFVEQNLPIE